MFGFKKKVIVEVSTQELLLIRESLMRLRDQLIADGRYTDAVDEMLVKIFA